MVRVALLDFILANTDIDVIVKFKKLAASSFVNLILGDCAGSIGFPQSFNTFLKEVIRKFYQL